MPAIMNPSNSLGNPSSLPAAPRGPMVLWLTGLSGAGKTTLGPRPGGGAA